jgi:hypothetical protein
MKRAARGSFVKESVGRCGEVEGKVCGRCDRTAAVVAEDGSDGGRGDGSGERGVGGWQPQHTTPSNLISSLLFFPCLAVFLPAPTTCSIWQTTLQPLVSLCGRQEAGAGPGMGLIAPTVPVPYNRGMTLTSTTKVAQNA